MSDQELQDLQQRNEQRAKELIANMGQLYVCHESNRIKRKSKTKQRRAKNGRFQ